MWKSELRLVHKNDELFVQCDGSEVLTVLYRGS